MFLIDSLPEENIMIVIHETIKDIKIKENPFLTKEQIEEFSNPF